MYCAPPLILSRAFCHSRCRAHINARWPARAPLSVKQSLASHQWFYPSEPCLRTARSILRRRHTTCSRRRNPSRVPTSTARSWSRCWSARDEPASTAVSTNWKIWWWRRCRPRGKTCPNWKRPTSWNSPCDICTVWKDGGSWCWNPKCLTRRDFAPVSPSAPRKCRSSLPTRLWRPTRCNARGRWTRKPERGCCNIWATASGDWRTLGWCSRSPSPRPAWPVRRPCPPSPRRRPRCRRLGRFRRTLKNRNTSYRSEVWRDPRRRRWTFPTLSAGTRRPLRRTAPPPRATTPSRCGGPGERLARSDPWWSRMWCF